MIRIDLLQKETNRVRPMLMGLGSAALVVVLGLVGLYWVDQRYPLYGAWNDFWAEVAQEDGGELAVQGMEEERREVVMLRDEREPGTDDTDLLQEKGPEAGEESIPAEEGVPDGEGVDAEVVAEDTVVRDEEEAVAAEPVAEDAPESELSEAAAPMTPVAEELTVDSAAIAVEESDDEVVPTEKTSGYRSALRWSAACLWAVKLPQRLPAGARFTSLNCRASGEYSLEGMSASRKEVEAFLETLEQLPSQVSLSWWREGRPHAGQVHQFKFNFIGQFDELYTRELEVLSADQAEVLSKKIAGWARQSGLGGLALEKPIETELERGAVQRRQKVQATGSYAEINAFLQQLKQVEDIATLGEVVIVPVYEKSRVWERARLYAAVDVLMRRP